MSINNDKKRALPFWAMSALLIQLTGCAVTPGLKTGELPQEGTFQASNGMQIDVQQLNVSTVDHLQQAATPAIALDEQSKLQNLFQQKQPLYTLDTGDVLSINLWAYPEITYASSGSANIANTPSNGYGSTNATSPLSYTIDQNGNIRFPLVGLIQARGKTVDQFTTQLSQRLAHYLKQPDAQVRVLAYQSRKFFVGGLVQQSGEFALTDQPLSAYGAIGKANGIKSNGAGETGDIQQIDLTRHGVSYHLNFLKLEKLGYSIHNLFMQDGDMLYVNSKENQQIYVLGEAGSAKPVPLREQGMTLSDVIGESSIDNQSANPSQVFVIRTDVKDNLTHVYRLDLGQIANLGLAQKFNMQANDTVYIDATGLARWSRVLAQIIPSATTLLTVKTLAQ